MSLGDPNDKYLLETPEIENYQGKLKTKAPKMTMDDAVMLGTLNDPELALKRIYDNDQGVLQEELESDSEQSIDFEKELK